MVSLILYSPDHIILSWGGQEAASTLQNVIARSSNVTRDRELWDKILQALAAGTLPVLYESWVSPVHFDTLNDMLLHTVLFLPWSPDAVEHGHGNQKLSQGGKRARKLQQACSCSHMWMFLHLLREAAMAQVETASPADALQDWIAEHKDALANHVQRWNMPRMMADASHVASAWSVSMLESGWSAASSLHQSSALRRTHSPVVAEVLEMLQWNPAAPPPTSAGAPRPSAPAPRPPEWLPSGCAMRHPVALSSLHERTLLLVDMLAAVLDFSLVGGDEDDVSTTFSPVDTTMLRVLAAALAGEAEGLPAWSDVAVAVEDTLHFTPYVNGPVTLFGFALALIGCLGAYSEDCHAAKHWCRFFLQWEATGRLSGRSVRVAILYHALQFAFTPAGAGVRPGHNSCIGKGLSAECGGGTTTAAGALFTPLLWASASSCMRRHGSFLKHVTRRSLLESFKPESMRTDGQSGVSFHDAFTVPHDTVHAMEHWSAMHCLAKRAASESGDPAVVNTLFDSVCTRSVIPMAGDMLYPTKGMRFWSIKTSTAVAWGLQTGGGSASSLRKGVPRAIARLSYGSSRYPIIRTPLVEGQSVASTPWMMDVAMQVAYVHSREGCHPLSAMYFVSDTGEKIVVIAAVPMADSWAQLKRDTGAVQADWATIGEGGVMLRPPLPLQSSTEWIARAYKEATSSSSKSCTARA